MKPTTALCLAALGFGLMYPGKNSRLAFTAGLTVLIVAVLDLSQILLNIELGIDRWVVPQDVVLEPGTGSFRVINGMPLAIALAGGALAVSRFEGHHFTAATLAGLAGVMAVFALLTYPTGIHTLYGPASVRPPALPSAVGMLCVASGIVLRIGAMPALRKPRPLWQLQIILGCAIVAPLLVFGAYAGFRIADAQLRLAREDLMIEARALSADVDREIIGEIEKLQALAASPSLRQGDFAEFQRQAEGSLALRQSGNIMLIDRDMRQLVNTWLPFGKPLPKAAVSGPAGMAFATGKLQITGLFMGSVTEQLMFAIIVPVQVDGENRYALVRSPNAHALAPLVAAQGLPSGWHAAVSDAAYRIIASQPNAFIGKELLPAERHRAGPDGAFEFVDSEGRPSVKAYAWSELTGWEAAVWAPKALLEAPILAQWRTLGVMAALAFALVVAQALWLGRTIARSVGAAARAAIALGKGGPLLPSATPVAEVATLMEELRKAAATRQAAEHNLQASKDRLQLAFDATRLGWWQYDPIRRVGSGDERFKEILDVTTDEIAIEDLMKRVHPDDAERFWSNREAALDPANPKPYVHHEYRVRRRDGEVRWVEGHGLAYFDGTGPQRRVVSFGGTVQDITERKEREEKEQLLMREINHRAKNMLSVVDSIAHQTASRNPDDFIERFSERIQALSANQDLLVRNEWKGVEIADLVHAQLAHFADLIGSRIAVLGPKLRLNAASAQAIGLALHELATNAGKYGALSTDRGRVDVCWGTDGDAFIINWTEREGPPVSAPKRRGFGTIVMEAMTARSVDGAVDLDYAPSGLTWRLTCPVANALETWERESNLEKSN
jgi:PAS domain S-box-containing protein